MKAPAKKLSKNLANRTKLTPDQLERVKGQAGGGRASVYNENGEQSLVLTRRLHAMKRKAKKFVLYTDIGLGRPIYISKHIPAKDSGVSQVTLDKSEALHFYEGFDDPAAKVAYWENQFKDSVFKLKFLTTYA